jgi:hypothetical protein
MILLSRSLASGIELVIWSHEKGHFSEDVLCDDPHLRRLTKFVSYSAAVSLAGYPEARVAVS